MKIRYILIGLALISGSILFSCDKIEEPYVKDTAEGDTTGIDTVTFNSLAQSARLILLEEFTGHKCPNCPAASKLAHDMKEANPGGIVIISVHAGIFSTSDGAGEFTYDFRTAEGTVLDQFFKVGDYGYPNALISRKKVNATRWVVAPVNWQAEFDSLKGDQPQVSLAVNSYVVNGTDIRTYIRAEFLEATSTLYNLCAVITEDSIVKPQKNNNSQVGPVPNIMDYVHEHVLRGSINGSWGSVLNNGPVAEKQGFLAGYTKTMGSDWNPAHLNVVVYVYDRESLEVIQVIEEKVR